ncbi:hypothetical protein D3C75_1322420 [compost metagenome]
MLSIRQLAIFGLLWVRLRNWSLGIRIMVLGSLAMTVALRFSPVNTAMAPKISSLGTSPTLNPSTNASA